MSLRRSTPRTRASRAGLLLTGLLALLAFALPGAATAQETQPESVLVCLADDDGSYVLLSVAPDRVAEYRRNSRNIVPAPVSGCPARVEDTADSSGSSSGSGSTDEPEAEEESDSGSGTAGETGSGGSDDEGTESSSGSGTAGESDSGSGGSDDAGTEGESASDAAEPSRLANTGSETWMLLGGGVLMIGLGTGISLRRRVRA